jgi:hypothetical protein
VKRATPYCRLILLPKAVYHIRNDLAGGVLCRRKGKAPVEEFLLALPLKHKAKVLALIKMLEQEGSNLPFPYSSQV